jgi:hypothetical protein
MQPSAHHRDLVTAYLLAQAGLPFTLRRDAAGRTQAAPVPDRRRTPRTSD